MCIALIVAWLAVPQDVGLFSSAALAKDGGSGGGSGNSGSGGNSGNSGSGSSGGDADHDSSHDGDSSGSGDGSGKGGSDNSGPGSDNSGGGDRKGDGGAVDEGRSSRGTGEVGRYLKVLETHGRVVGTHRSEAMIEVRYSDGWRETIIGKRYRLYNDDNRRIVDRVARPEDFARLRSAGD